MKKSNLYKLSFLILLSTHLVFSQSRNTTYKDKNGNQVGHSKEQGNTATYYNKSGNKTGSAKTSSNGTITFYNRQGNKVGTAKTK